MNKELSNKIYYLTFILAILVVCLHCSFINYLNPELGGYNFAYITHRTLMTIGDSTVPTFFVISGYLLFSKFTLDNYPHMLLKKVFSLVIPYFIWSVLGFISIKIVYPLMNNEALELSFQSVSLDILLANGCPQIWFVRPLLVYFIASPLLYFIFKYLKKWSIFIPVSLFIVYIFFRPDYFGLLFWIPLFFTGSYLAYFKINIFNRYKPRLFALIAIAILITIGILFGTFKVAEDSTLYFCYRFISVVFIYFAIDVIYNLYFKEDIKEVFKISAFIFFAHFFIAILMGMLLRAIIPTNNNYICASLFILNWILTASIVVALGYTLKRFVKPVYKLLAGWR